MPPEVIGWLTALVASAALTGVVRLYAVRVGILDLPKARSSHNSPTARGGGLAILGVWTAALVLTHAAGRLPQSLTYALLIGGLLVGSIGFLDDRRDVSAAARIVVHFVSAGLFMALVSPTLEVQLAQYVLSNQVIGWMLAIFLMVWLINLFNFMDGVDGIAGSEAAFVLVGAVIVDTLVPSERGAIISAAENLQVIFASACLGFLVWNWPPARIFMGDVGSGLLGFVVGAFLVYSVSEGFLVVWTWLILTGVFVVDATLTLLRRMSRGERWYEAHRSHAYQRVARQAQSHTFVTAGVLGLNCLWLLPMACLAEANPGAAWLYWIVAWAPLAVIWAYVDRRERLTTTP